MSELHWNTEYIKSLAEAEARDRRQQTEKRLREKLQAKATLSQKITESGIIRSIRRYAQESLASASERMLDPAKRNPGEDTESLRVEALVHKKYVELFDAWEKEGESAMKKMAK
jgi:hypothetical protein